MTRLQGFVLTFAALTACREAGYLDSLTGFVFVVLLAVELIGGSPRRTR